MGVRVSSPILIGRQAELAELRAAVDAADSGAGGPVLIAGEAGIGKSRLVSEFARWAQDNGHRVLAGACVDLSAEVAPYAPILQALRGWPEARSTATRETPSGPQTLDGAAALGISPDHGHGRLLDVLLAQLTAMARDAPTILVIEDLQWVDTSTADALTFLTRNLRDEPLLIVATYRSDETALQGRLLTLVSDLARHPRFRRIDLQRLDRAELGGLLDAILSRPAGVRVVDEVYARSQGNAFMAEELLAANTADGEMPLTLRDALAAHVARLTPGARELVRIASAGGREFSERMLSSLAEFEAAAFRSALRDAIEQNILVRGARQNPDRLRFRHALMQELLYGDLLASERTRVHSAAAEFIESELDTRTDAVLASELAYHWQAADVPDRALGAAIGAGLAAESAHAPPEAAAQFERALTLFERLDNPPPGLALDHVGVLEHAAANELSQPDRAAAHIHTAISSLEAEGDQARLGLLHAALGRYLWFAGDGAGALAECRTAVRLVGDHGTSAQRARVLAGLAQILMILAEFTEAAEVANDAVELARAADERAIEGHALCTLGVVVSYQGEIDVGLGMLRDAFAIARDLDSEDDMGRAVSNMVDVQIVNARFADAVEVARHALRMDPPLAGVWPVVVSLDACWALYSSGEWDEAIGMLERARMHPAAGVGEIEWILRRAQLLVGRGEFKEADRHLEMLDRMLQAAADTQWLAPAATAEAERAIWAGDHEQACRAVGRALDRVHPSTGANVSRIGPMLAMGMRAAAEASSSSPSPAIVTWSDQFMTEIRRIHGEASESWPGQLNLVEPWLAMCEAEATRVAGRSDRERWTEATRLFGALRMPYMTAYALLREAEAALTLRRDSAAGRDALRAAALICRRLTARPLLAAIEDVASRARVDLESTNEAPPMKVGTLSGRELEVLGLLAAGLTNREIGDRLFITTKTASHHVSSVLGKLGVRTRSQAAAEAVRLGIPSGHVIDAGTSPSQPE